MKLLRYFFGSLWCLFVWLMVAILIGLVVVTIFPPQNQGETVMVGIGTNWRNLPGTIIGFLAARQSWRKHVSGKVSDKLEARCASASPDA